MKRLMPHAVSILDHVPPHYSGILKPEALSFAADLARAFEPNPPDAAPARRSARQADFDAGRQPDFLPETRDIRESDWTVASIPADLQDQRVEITGPTGRKMVINALNCGASVFMADFEDGNTPTWDNLIEGQNNLRDAVNRTISYASPDGSTVSTTAPRRWSFGRCAVSKSRPRYGQSPGARFWLSTESTLGRYSA